MVWEVMSVMLLLLLPTNCDTSAINLGEASLVPTLYPSAESSACKGGDGHTSSSTRSGAPGVGLWCPSLLLKQPVVLGRFLTYTSTHPLLILAVFLLYSIV